ncbi:MAG: nitronate monooxygenase [Acetobacteraceae bacterium]|nr:nitronate monooxygenase [Acetobacteraceae bacterium]
MLGLVAALALGADGVAMGTRFLATPEANAHGLYKRDWSRLANRIPCARSSSETAGPMRPIGCFRQRSWKNGFPVNPKRTPSLGTSHR